jgi:hypothetical protein
MKVILQSILSLILGFCGGIISVKLAPRLQSRGFKPDITARTVRAERFELVDPSNRLNAYWGRDWQGGRILIAFFDEKDRPRAQFGVESSAAFNSNFAPFTALLGSDGRIRIQQRLDSSQRPVLTMGDAASETRLLLGHWLTTDMPGDDKDPWDKWSLVFPDLVHGGDSLDLGATTPLNSKRRTGYVVLRDSAGHVLRDFPK